MAIAIKSGFAMGEPVLRLIHKPAAYAQMHKTTPKNGEAKNSLISASLPRFLLNRHNCFYRIGRSRKGYGPARIRQELNQKGISREATEKAMRECDIDWCALARDQATRKYGEPLPTVFSEKVKIQRFLLYRGYLMEDIQDIWRNFAD